MILQKYIDLISHSFDFPQEEFELKDGYLHFNGIPLKKIIDTYGTPLKLTYLPKVSSKIQSVKTWFDRAFQQHQYRGNYYYCYATKSCSLKYIMEKALQNQVQIETSSAIDITIMQQLFAEGKISKDTYIINNGFKTEEYAKKICELINAGFHHTIPILDNPKEITYYEQHITQDKIPIGIRVATEEEPVFSYYTSRLGMPYREVIPFYRQKIELNPKIELKMLHFFVYSGIADTVFYWSELREILELYCELKKICPTLNAINIGGGLPIKQSLSFEYDYQYMISEIVSQIKQACDAEGIDHPDIFTEFGKFSVGESGATIFSVIGQKQQNDAELWYIIDNSFVTTLPDSWGLNEAFILLPINKWDNEFQRANIGGISFDNTDYYNSEVHPNELYLPKISESDPNPLYIGFFHTGAYQDSLLGYSGIPAPKHIWIDIDAEGKLIHSMNFGEQTEDEILKILGF